MNAAQRESIYGTLARLSGLTLIVLCVLFQRRGLLDWTELVFLGLCIGLQESFIRLPMLRKFRAPMLVVYSMLPLALVLSHAREIHSYQGDFVQIVLNTPLPLVLVSVQIMVLYVKDAPRLVSVVLVLALFSTVIGVRRPIDDSVWPWLTMIGASGAMFLMMQHPGMLFHGVYVARRPGALPPAGRPGGVVRGAFFSVLPLFTMSVLIASIFLYFALPRFEPSQAGPAGLEIAENPQGGSDPGGPSDPNGGGTPRNPRDPRDRGPASVSGLSDGVDLGDFGEIKRSTTPALNVELVAPEGFVEPVYLRAFTYATFDGFSWLPLPEEAQNVSEVPTGDRRTFPGELRANRRGHEDRRYRITVLESGIGAGGQLPLPVEPIMMHEFQGTLYYNSASQTARAPMIRNGDVYEVTAKQLTLTDSQMKNRLRGVLPDLPPRMEYLQVPPTLKQEVQRRFNQVAEPEDGSDLGMGLYDRFGMMANSDGAYATAAGLAHMFHTATSTDGSAWVYSLDFRPEPGADAIARFLDTTNPKDRVGHCEYFASAMCVLLRCFDIPSRVVAGFLAKGANADGVFEVDASAAHAWVEVWIDGFGWVTFDPTPGEDRSETENPGDPEDEDPEGETEPDTETDQQDDDEAGKPEVDNRDWFERYDSHQQKQMFDQVGSYLDEGARAVDDFLENLTGWLPGFLPRSGVLRAALLIVPPGVLLFVFLLSRRKRKKIEAKLLQQMGEGGKKKQRGLYFQLLLLLAKHGFQKRASETPREFAERVTRKGGAQHEPILELTELYYALRFGLNHELETDFKRALSSYADALKSASSDRPPSPRSA